MTDEKLILEALSWLLCTSKMDKMAREVHAQINKRLMEMAGVTVMEVYGKNLEQMDPPKGWRFTKEFVQPVEGQWCMHPDGFAYIHHGMNPDGPRLILVKCKRLVFDIVDENRPPRSGELANWKHTVVESDGGAYSPQNARYVLSEPRVEE